MLGTAKENRATDLVAWVMSVKRAGLQSIHTQMHKEVGMTKGVISETICSVRTQG